MQRCDEQLKTLLYKNNAPTAFKIYDNPCVVTIKRGSEIVNIVDITKEDGFGSNPIIKQYKLIKRHDPIWTDDTKNQYEVMVKLIVEELK